MGCGPHKRRLSLQAASQCNQCKLKIEAGMNCERFVVPLLRNVRRFSRMIRQIGFFKKDDRKKACSLICTLGANSMLLPMLLHVSRYALIRQRNFQFCGFARTKVIFQTQLILPATLWKTMKMVLLPFALSTVSLVLVVV